MISIFFHLVRKFILATALAVMLVATIFIGYKANQPMKVTGAPAGMTYIEFMQDRLEAAKTVKPSRCGWGMMLSLAALGPIYSLNYTYVATHPESFLAKVTAPDPDIPKNVAGAKWYEVPGIWWIVVERLSWTMLAKQQSFCWFGPVLAKY